MIKNYVTFNSSLPVDQIENERGDVKFPAGKNLLVLIWDQLQLMEKSTIEPHEFYGWKFFFMNHGIKYLMLIQVIDHYLVIIKPQLSLINRIFRDCSAEQEETLRQMYDLFKRLPEVYNVQWFTAKEYAQL